MSEPTITALNISGHSDSAVPNKFFRQSGSATELAVIFPGLRYTCDMPLLYYPTRLLLGRGADVLQLHTDYNHPDFEQASPLARAQWLGADALAGVQTGLTMRPYDRLILVGKSIGTLEIGFLLAGGIAASATTIWLTPLLHQPLLVQAASQCRAPALFIASDADSTYDPAAMQRIQQACGARSLILSGANHSLEVPGDPLRSVQYLQAVVESIASLFA